MNTVGNRLVATGGASGNGDINTVEIFDGATWKLANWTLSMGRGYHCAATLSDSELIVAGGWSNGQLLDSVEKYNVVTGQRTQLPNMGTNWQCVACTVTGNKFIVSGASFVQALDLSTNTLSNLPNMVESRGCHTMAAVNGQLMVFGGWGNGYARSTYERLNGSAWTATAMSGRGGHAMVVLPCP